ncbi:XRE family transcriptional regulator [Desulfosarcina alkanivorans]|nr:XRE family transcriptional regulator [Desulfosarcina alkanivorans]
MGANYVRRQAQNRSKSSLQIHAMTTRVNINPEILVWSRRVAGLVPVNAARKIGTTPERLDAWENGDALPTVIQLRKIGKVYHKPAAFFYLETPPPLPPEIPDFRRLPDAFIEKSPELLSQIQIARSKKETAIQLYEQLGHTPPDVDLSIQKTEGTTIIANKLRDYLSVSLETQMGWSDKYEGLRGWIEALEAKGVMVFQFSGVSTTEVRGFALSERPVPVIAINGSDSPLGRIFTVLHEFAHIAANEGGLCDLHNNHEGYNYIEPFFNQIAGEILVPSFSLQAQEQVRVNNTEEWEDRDLSLLAKRFTVGREVILRRLLSLGLTTERFYRMKRGQYLDQYKRMKKAKGFLAPHRKALRDSGKAFTHLLFNAYYNNVLSARDFSKHLGNVKQKHIRTIGHELGIGY